EDLADGTDAGLAEMIGKAVEHLGGAAAILRMRAQPRVHEWANQPGPNRALMIGGIAGPKIAIVLRLEVRASRRQRAEPEWGQQPMLHHGKHGIPARRIEHGVPQRDRKHLIRSTGCIIAGLAINNIVEIAALREPEASVERRVSLFRVLRVGFRLGVALFPS